MQPAAAAIGAYCFETAEPAENKRHVPAGEIEMLDVADLQLRAAVAEIDHAAGRARARHRGDLVDGEFALGEDVQHLPPDIAGRADHDHPVAHFLVSAEARRRPYRMIAAESIWHARTRGQGRGG